MKKDRGALLFLAHGAMELSWRYAWATFLMTSIVHRPFPLPEAIGTFFLAATLSLVVRGIGFAGGHGIGDSYPGVFTRCLEDRIHL